jgi:dTDP-4-dehydrorhamnose 3,5-epimerase
LRQADIDDIVLRAANFDRGTDEPNARARASWTRGANKEQTKMMIAPVKSAIIASPDLKLADFRPDAPSPRATATPGLADDASTIHQVTTLALVVHSDQRGSLCELMTTRDGPIEPIVHVYQVMAEVGSVRAWVYHRQQYDRLAFTQGLFRVVLYDVRPDSPTRNMLNVFVLGGERPTLLRIPPYVIHGVQNIGSEVATFVNMPTKVFQPGEPDKCRLDAGDRRIPFRFDE